MKNETTAEHESTKHITIKPPKFDYATFRIVGCSPLVIHRMSKKIADQLGGKQETGKAAGSKKIRDPQSPERVFNEARYRSKDGWDGFNAAAIRIAMIDCCRLVDYKMTLAKLSIFVIEDGRDALEPQIPLIRIYGEPIMQKDVADGRGMARQ